MMLKPRFIAGLAIGAVVMYLADPASGKGRRHRWADQARAARRRRQRAAERRERYESGRRDGERAMARGAGHFHPTDDRSVELHLHQVLAGIDADTADVNVEVVAGLARLRGQVWTMADAHAVIAAVSAGRGVRRVESWLHLPGEPAPNKAAVAGTAAATASVGEALT